MMKIANKTQEKLTEETEALRLRIAELEKIEAECKGMENVFEQSIEHFQTLLEEAPIGVCNTDLKGKITYVNKRFEEVSGYSRQEVVGKNGFKLGMFSVETLKLLVKRLSERLRGGPTRVLEVQFKCKDGHWIWIAMEGKIMREKGVPVGFQLLSRDITERKQAEQVLRESGAKYKTIFENVSDVIVRLDRRGKIIDANKRVEDYFGYKPDEIIGKNFTKLGVLSLKDLPKMAKLFSEGVKGKPFPRMELEVKRKDGSTAHLEANSTLVKKNGKAEGFVAIVRDITERKQAEEALQVEKNKLQSVIDALEDGLSIQDKDYNIIYQNEQLINIIGNHLGEKCYRAYEGKEKLCDGCPVKKAFKDGKSHTSERRVVTPSGEIDFLENTANPIRDARGRIVSCLEITRNINKRRQIEDELKQRAQILDSATDSIFVHDPDDNFVYVNEAACRTHGYSREEFMKMKLPQIVAPERVRGLGLDRRELLEKGHIVTGSAHVRKDGSIIPVEVHARTIETSGGKLFLTVARDITEHKQAEEALQVEKNKLQSVIDALEYGLTIQDKDYNIIYQNGPLKTFFGDHLGEKCYRVYEGKDRVCDECPVKKVFKDGKSHSIERRVINRSGEVEFREYTANPIRDARGKIVSCLEVTKNITERKQAEEKLRESEERYRHLFESSHDMVQSVAPDGRFLFVNRAWLETMGYTEAELPELNLFKIIHPDSLPHCREMFSKVMAGETITNVQATFVAKDGRSVLLEGSAAGRYIGGKLYATQGIFRDITERKQAEEALRESEVSLKEAQRVAKMGSWELDLAAGKGAWSAEMFRLTGFDPSKEAPIFAEFLEWVHPEDQQRVSLEFHEHVRQTGESATAEFRSNPARGPVRNFLANISAVRDAQGQVVRIMGTLQDITEQKQAEEARREAEEKYKNLVEAISDVIWETDEKGTFTFVSPRIKDTLGYEADEIVGRRKTLDFTPKAEEQKWLRRFTEINAKRKPFSGFEITHIHKNGNPVVFETSGIPFFDSARNFKGFIGINKDITERKQAEEEIERQKAYFQQLFDNSPEGIALLDDADRFVQVNKAFETLFGYRTEEIKGKSINEVIVPGDYLEEASSLSRAVLNDQVCRRETVRKRKDGSLVDVDAIGYPIKFDNQTVGVYVIYSDITERKKAERALRESQEKLRKMFESVADGISVIDLGGVITEVNQRMVEMHGFNSKEELLGKNAFDLVAPRDRERVATNMRKALEQGAIKGVEYTLLRADGSEFLGELSTNMLKDDSGNVVGHISIARDITERKQAEKVFETLATSSPIGIYIIQDRAFQFVSPQFQAFLGYSEDELLDMDPLKFVHPEDGKMVREKAIRMLKGGHSAPYEYRYISKDGQTKWVMETVVSIQFRGRRATLGNFLDVTERKRAEEALRESQEFSSSLLESSPNPIFVVNPDTSIKYVNPAFEKLTDFTLAEITGRKAPYPWWPEEQKREIASAFKDAMISGGDRDEWSMRKKNGERFWVAVNSAPVMHEGKLLYFLVSWLDITERKRAEEERIELEQKAHLASRLASVGEMAAGIAHEINNPMTAVIGFSQLLMDSDLPDEIAEDITVIHKEAQRAANVARNLLTFARKHAPTKQMINVNSIIEGVLKLRAYEQTVSNIRVNTRFASDLPEVMADHSQMQQVFINIILNAEAAMLEANNGGSLTVTTQRVNDTVRASFTDSGPGIAKENLNRIFDPFFTTKEVGKGTGLGLSVCHGIVAEHGGRLYARSKSGQGATFVVELPVDAHASGGRN